MAESIAIALAPEPKEQAESQATQNTQPTFEEMAAQIEQLRQELADSRGEAAAARDEAKQAQLAVTVQQTKAPAQKINSASQDLARQKAINAMGNARYHALPPNERLKLQGYQPATDSDVAESRRIFGKGSSSLEAAQIGKHNPGRYSFLRAVAREFGIY